MSFQSRIPALLAALALTALAPTGPLLAKVKLAASTPVSP